MSPTSTFQKSHVSNSLNNLPNMSCFIPNNAIAIVLTIHPKILTVQFCKKYLLTDVSLTSQTPVDHH